MSLNYVEIVIPNKRAIAILNTDDLSYDDIDEFLDWCKDDPAVERHGTLIKFETDEDFIMFKLKWG